MVKNPPAKAGDADLIPGSGRAPGGGDGNTLQCSCLENPMDRGAGWATVCGVTKSQTRLNPVHSLLQITTHCVSVIHSFLCFSCSFRNVLEQHQQKKCFRTQYSFLMICLCVCEMQNPSSCSSFITHFDNEWVCLLSTNFPLQPLKC